MNHMNHMKQKREKVFEYEAIFSPNGSGYTVTIPKLPGLVTEGKNLSEAKMMARDAIRCHLEAILKDAPARSSSSFHRIRVLAMA